MRWKPSDLLIMIKLMLLLCVNTVTKLPTVCQHVIDNFQRSRISSRHPSTFQSGTMRLRRQRVNESGMLMETNYKIATMKQFEASKTPDAWFMEHKKTNLASEELHNMPPHAFKGSADGQAWTLSGTNLITFLHAVGYWPLNWCLVPTSPGFFTQFL